MDNFLDSFFDVLNAEEFEDELRTIFFAATQKADRFLGLNVCQEFSPEDARIMALSLGVALELIQRYENHKDKKVE